MNEFFYISILDYRNAPPVSASSSEVMNSGVRFIICTISSALCDRTDSICGGRAGKGPSSLCGLALMGNGTEGGAEEGIATL